MKKDITVKTFDDYENYLSHVYAEGLTEMEAISFFSHLGLSEETIKKHIKARTLGKLVRKYDGTNFISGYSEWLKDA